MSINHDELYDYLTGEEYVTEECVKKLLVVQRNKTMKVMHTYMERIYNLEDRVAALERLIKLKAK